MKISKFTESIILIAIVFLILRFGIHPPIPSSLIYFYMAIAIFAIFLYISLNNRSLSDFLHPIKATILERNRRPLRVTIFILLPITISSLTYLKISGRVRPPAELRSIHPAPPAQIKFREKTLNIIGLENPFRANTANYERCVEEGAQIYFKNCFFCHGDNLDGKGHFAPALNPPPANFVDKGTIAQLQESFVFWRVSKGGTGLPNEGAPWNSAMPAWEKTLTEEEIWKVIMYIYEAAGVEPRTWENRTDATGQGLSPVSLPPSPLPTAPDSAQGHGRDKPVLAAGQDSSAPPANAQSEINSPQSEAPNRQSSIINHQSAEVGQKIYLKKCQYCHGVNGKGDGPAAESLYPRPRDLTKARYKIKSTPPGALPSDQDIFRVISNGIPGTSMPAWTSLTETERWQVVEYIKTMAKRFVRSKEKGGPPPEPIKVGSPIPTSGEGIEKGRALFERLKCWECHGQKGHGDGPNALTLKDDWGHPIRPSNLWRDWDFKGGSSNEDIYRTLVTGRAGTPMPSFMDGTSEDDRWHLTNYVKSIAPPARPKRAAMLISHFITGDIPSAPNDPVWDSIEADEFPLFGQIIVEPRMFTPSIDAIYVRSVFNDDEICFLLEWDDTRESILGVNETGGVIFSDAAAIQFPSQIPQTSASQRPYFLMGNKASGVNLWYWNGGSGLKEINAHGIDDRKDRAEKDSGIKGSAAYQDGRYSLLISRSLTTNDSLNDVQFEVNRFIPISFFLWDGHNGETGAKTSLSTWCNLFLEKKETMSRIIYSVIAGVFVVAFEVIVIWRVRRHIRE